MATNNIILEENEIHIIFWRRQKRKIVGRFFVCFQSYFIFRFLSYHHVLGEKNNSTHSPRSLGVDSFVLLFLLRFLVKDLMSSFRSKLQLHIHVLSFSSSSLYVVYFFSAFFLSFRGVEKVVVVGLWLLKSLVTSRQRDYLFSLSSSEKERRENTMVYSAVTSAKNKRHEYRCSITE